MTHEVHIRHGRLVNDDPQRRCYHGCFYKSHWEWGPWEVWMDAKSKEYAESIVRGFSRDTQQLKVVAKETTL